MTDPTQLRGYLESFASAMMTHLQQRPAIGQPLDSRLFTTPNGKIFTVSVEDDGTVKTEELGSVNTGTVPPT